MSFDLQPSLNGTRIELRPLHPEDLDDLYSVARDPLIWEQHPARRYERKVFQQFFKESLESGGALIVLDANTKETIGSSRYYGYDEEKSEVEIGWTFLARPYWGGETNAELKQLMLEHAFKFVDSVLLYIDPENKRSQRAAEKIGAIRDPDDQNGRLVFRISR